MQTIYSLVSTTKTVLTFFHSELERTEGKEIVYGSQFEPYKN